MEFDVGAGVTGFSGAAAWAANGGSASTSPRLVGFGVELLDAANNVIASDSFNGVLNGIAVSSFAQMALAPGHYTLVATGIALRDTVLDVSLTFSGVTAPVPEPETWALLIAGLGLMAAARRRRSSAAPRTSPN